MKPKDGTEIDACEPRSTPKEVIAYLSYVLEEVRVLSPRGTLHLAAAITALEEDTQSTMPSLQ